MRRAFVDLHCHTSRQLRLACPSPADVVRAAAARGLTHLAITDHDRIDGALAARDAAPDGLTVIVGEEIRTADGDLICAVPRASRSRRACRRRETIAAVREQGGLVGHPAPVRPLPRLAPARRGGWTRSRRWSTGSRPTTPASSAAATSGRRRSRASSGLPGVAVSDAHSVLEVGVAYTALDGRSVDARRAPRRARPTAELVPGRASVRRPGPHAVAKVVQRRAAVVAAGRSGRRPAGGDVVSEAAIGRWRPHRQPEPSDEPRRRPAPHVASDLLDAATRVDVPARRSRRAAVARSPAAPAADDHLDPRPARDHLALFVGINCRTFARRLPGQILAANPALLARRVPDLLPRASRCAALRWAMLLRGDRASGSGRGRDRDHLPLVARQLPRAGQARATSTAPTCSRSTARRR